jgi:hypothetical protein
LNSTLQTYRNESLLSTLVLNLHFKMVNPSDPHFLPIISRQPASSGNAPFF